MHNARVWTILMQSYFLELQGNARLKHLKIVGPKRGGLFRRKYFLILFPSNLFLADAQDSFEILIHEQITALRVFEKDRIGAIV